jgi:hypothetical protein
VELIDVRLAEVAIMPNEHTIDWMNNIFEDIVQNLTSRIIILAVIESIKHFMPFYGR